MASSAMGVSAAPSKGSSTIGVDPVVDEGLDLLDLDQGVVGAFGNDQLDIVVLLGDGAGRLGDRRHPAVVGGRSREADGDGVTDLVVGALLGFRGAAFEVLVGIVRLVARAGAESEHGDHGKSRRELLPGWR